MANDTAETDMLLRALAEPAGLTLEDARAVCDQAQAEFLKVWPQGHAEQEPRSYTIGCSPDGLWIGFVVERPDGSQFRFSLPTTAMNEFQLDVGAAGWSALKTITRHP